MKERMKSACYGLSMEQDNHQGRYWLLKGMETPLRMEELSELDVRMLEKAPMPALLPLDLEGHNGELVLRYRLPLGQTLEAYMKSKGSGIRRVLELLLSIVQILESSRTYMLDEHKFMLTPSLLIVGHQTQALHVGYLPLRVIEGKRSLRQELYELALLMLNWSGETEERYPVLLDCLRSALFELSEFKQLLMGLLQEELLAGTAPAASRVGFVSTNSWSSTAEATSIVAPSVQGIPAGAVESSGNARIESRVNAGSREVDEDPLLQEGDTLRFHTSKGFAINATEIKVLLLLVLLAGAGVAWQPSPLTIYLGSGFVGAVFGAFLLYKWWRSKEDKDHGIMEVWEEEFDVEAESDQPNSLVHPGFKVEEGTLDQGRRTFDWGSSDRELYHSSPAQTVFLMQPEETTQLGQVMETVVLQPSAYLEWGPEGDSDLKTISLTKDRFTYGRSPEDVDWVLQESGISRKHGEIVRVDRSWQLRDLHSRNGSRLNGSLVEPGQGYDLKDGDRIEAAGISFIFRCG